MIDLSHNLDNTTQVYPGDPPFTSVPFTTVAKDGYSVHSISMSSHTGTHVDAPSHFFADGQTIDQIPLSTFVGPALIVDLRHKGPSEKIVWSDLAVYEDMMKPGTILIFHTGWSKHWGTVEYLSHPFVEKEVAERVIALGIRVLGVDTLSPDETGLSGHGGKEGFGVHEVILGSGGLIIENLTNLDALKGENIMVSFIPLKIVGSDGSPVRAIAWKNDN